MNNSEEIKGQNQLDCFVKMYTYLADAVLENGGTRGERAIREGLIQYGENKGKQLRESHIEKGIKTNLASLIHSENCCGEDPRFYRTVLKDGEQVQLYEVYSCPLERMWRVLSESEGVENSLRAGTFYCEECVHAVVRGYTEGKGQANLSDRLTCGRDTHCRFSLYLRPANLDEAQRVQSFGEGGLLPSASFDLKENFIKLYYCLLCSSGEVLGSEGVCFIAKGLKRLEADLIKSLKLEAAHLDRPLDREFMRDFFPMKLDQGTDSRWNQYPNCDAQRLLFVNLLDPLKEKLKL